MPHIQTPINGYAPLIPSGVIASLLWWLRWRNGPFAPHGLDCEFCAPHLHGETRELKRPKHYDTEKIAHE